MASDNMEVSITLTPVAHGKEEEVENHRVIKINSERSHIDIGRASKNPNKGLLVGSDNAWFECPILSRYHAKFTASLLQKKIYIQDCNSTHGTYLNKQKLQPGLEYNVDDGEMITFGVKVTSGSTTFPPKDFRVNSDWNSRRCASPTWPSSPVKSGPAGYHVPEYDQASSSEPSREGSVQIIESHPRIYSVPSSDPDTDSDEDDNESVEIASSIQGTFERSSAVTTPDHQAAGREHDQSKIVTLNPHTAIDLTGPCVAETIAKVASTGTSQQNPIDIEGVTPPPQDVEDTGSEDDGPEILPIPQASLRPPNVDGWSEPQLATQQYQAPAVSENATDLDTEDQVKRIIRETQARVDRENQTGGAQSPQWPEYSIAEATDGFDSPDEDEFDEDDGFPVLQEELSDQELLYADRNSDLLKSQYMNPSLLQGMVQAENIQPIHQVLAATQKEYKPAPCVFQAVESIDISQPRNGPPSSSVQRAPSPSDAAMARIPSEPRWRSDRNGTFDSSEYPRTTTHFHYSPFDPSQSYSAKWAAAYNPFSRFEPISYPSVKSQESPRSKRYEQGPFSLAETEPRSPSPSPPTRPEPMSYTLGDESKKNNIDFTALPGLNKASEGRISKLQRSPSPMPTARPGLISYLWDDESKKNKSGITVNLGPHKASEGQSSKINISNLVNSSYTEKSRPLKRKAQEISSGSETEEPAAALSQSQDALTHVEDALTQVRGALSSVQSPPGPPSSKDDRSYEQETPLPDAQERDMAMFVDSTSFVQDSIVEPSSDSAPISFSTSAVTQTIETEGPTRKRARTSSARTGGGIGKFVSGVCVGLVGAVAAFVATIPSNVREEALRELANAA